MKALILVGGKGTRMYPLTHHLPKPMVPIANVPFIERMIRWLATHGVDEVIFSMGYLPGAIQEHFDRYPVPGVQIRYVVEDHPLGTGGGIKNAARGLTETFLALNGDVLTDMDASAAVELHRRQGAKVTIGLAPVDDPTQYGVVETDINGRILQFTEKPAPEEVRSNLINAGLYVLEPEAIAEIPEGVEFSIERQLFPELLRRGEPLYGYDASTHYWIDIGTPEKYLTANWDVLHGKVSVEIPGLAKQGVWMGEGCRMVNGAALMGPSAVGRNCLIGAGVKIGPCVILGDNVVVEDGAMLRDCVIWSETTVGQEATVEGAVIGRRCTVQKRARIGPHSVHEDGATIN